MINLLSVKYKIYTVKHTSSSEDDLIWGIEIPN